MKKTYEKPILQTEVFDVDDVITVSVPGGGDTPQAEIPEVHSGWETGLVPDIHFN